MKTAFVTGASRGIGKAIAQELAQKGYFVSLAATNEAKLQEAAKDLPHSLIFPLDVRDEEEVKKACDQTHQQTGRIDLLVNAAGILLPHTSELSTQDLHNLMDVNLFGSFYAMKATLPYMKKQGCRFIINIASRAGKLGRPKWGGYSASKFALNGLNEALFYELASSNIKVSSICPGWVDTDMASTYSNLAKEKCIPVDDVVKAVSWLLDLSPRCSVKEIILDCTSSIA